MTPISSKMTVDLNNKIALITGASRGIGAHFARVLSDNGAHVIVSGRASALQELEAIVKQIQKKGNKASVCILDVTDINSFKPKVNALIQEFNSIDILVNNAGVSIDKHVFDITESDWDVHFNTNLKGMFFLSQTIALHMKEQKNGYSSIINIGAVNGQKVRKNCLSYSTAKAAVLHLTKLLAYELIDYKIKVNALSLGLFPSKVVNNFLTNNPQAREYINRIPCGRVGRHADLDGPLLLLASDASDYMHGEIINVDGGFSINVFMDTALQMPEIT